MAVGYFVELGNMQNKRSEESLQIKTKQATTIR